MFAEIVLIFEFLSLFTAISETGLIVLNVLFTIISGVIWIKYGKPILKLNPKPFFTKLANTLKRDKYLLVLGISFIFMCLVSLFLISIMPVNNADAMSYHVSRSLFWIGNRNLNHFDISQARMLSFPINSEILYAWILMLTKKQLWLGIFQFIGFWMGLISLYGLMSYINISERKKLWVLFLAASFPSVLAEISSTETDLIIAGLVLASMYLYWNSLKTRFNLPLIISSICYALAIGTKTTAIILIPAVGLWMAVISYHYDKKKFYKPLLKFICCGFISFILFASYNYILNYINYGNIAGNSSLLAGHVNYCGIKGMFANFVKTLFLFLDFTGFTWGNYLGTHIAAAKTAILSSIGLGTISDGVYSNAMRMSDSNNLFHYLENTIGMGILGFLVYLPCWVKSMITPVRSKKYLYIFNFGLLLLIALLFMSYEIMFMSFNIRFLTCFCFIAAPVLVYSYPRKNHVLKSIITFFALFSLIFVSTNISFRPAAKIFAYFRAGKTISEIRETAKCSLFFKTVHENSPKLRPACHIESAVRSFDKQNKILYFSDDNEFILYVKMLMFEGYQIDFGRIENLQNIDLTQYNIIITTNDAQMSSNIIYDNMSYFSPQKGADCVYQKLFPILYEPYIDKMPYNNIFCQLSPEFFSANGFKLYSPLILYSLENMHSKNAKKIEYRFYENVNRGIL